MSRSLNSDYLDQLLIKADTSGLDGDLVRLAAEERPVPEEQQALLVFKRGYGLPFGFAHPQLSYWQLIVILVITKYHVLEDRPSWSSREGMACLVALDPSLALLAAHSAPTYHELLSARRGACSTGVQDRLRPAFWLLHPSLVLLAAQCTPGYHELLSVRRGAGCPGVQERLRPVLSFLNPSNVSWSLVMHNPQNLPCMSELLCPVPEE